MNIILEELDEKIKEVLNRSEYICKPDMRAFYPTINDKTRIKEYLNKVYGITSLFAYKKIIFNEPATIILWNDGTKTVVKCQDGDVFDKEKGIALCFMKKALGNKSNFNNVITNAIKKEDDKYCCIKEAFEKA